MIARSGPLGRTLRQLRNLAGSVDAAWQGWVLDFSSEQQNRLLNGLGLRAYGELALAGLMMTSVALVMGLILAALMRQGQPQDPVTRHYALLCRRLARVGLTRAPGEGPADFARRVGAARPDLAVAVAVQQIVGLYVRCHYMAHHTAADGERLALRVRGFRPRANRNRPGRPV